MSGHGVVLGRARLRACRAVVAGVLTLGLGGCITKTAVLTNDRGQTQICEKKGRVGIFSEYVLNKRFESCLENAAKDGYRQAPPTPSGSK